MEWHFCPECFDKCDCADVVCSHCPLNDDVDWNDYDANDGTEG